VVDRSIWPAGFALGVVVLLVGLVIDPLTITPLGAAIALLSGMRWVRSSQRSPQAASAPAPNRSLEPAGERFPRSRFLERATLALGGLVGLGVLAPAASFVVLPSFLGRRRKSVDLGPVNAFPEGQFVVVRFLSDRSAGAVSRRAAYIRNNGLLGELPSFTILSSRCTHVGCPTQPNGQLLPQSRTLERTSAGEVSLVPAIGVAGFGCPCHGSQFDSEGNRTAGPAPRALDRYEFSVRNGHLLLDRLYSVSHVDGEGAVAQIHAFGLQGAGQPLTGLESLLYPIKPSQ
jgi:Rieske Fe-S protein